MTNQEFEKGADLKKPKNEYPGKPMSEKTAGGILAILVSGAVLYGFLQSIIHLLVKIF